MVVVLVLVVGESCLQLGSSGEEHAGEKLVSKLSEEALDIGVLPRHSRLEEAIGDAFGKFHRSEFRTVVRDDRLWLAVNEEEPFELLLYGK